MHHHLSRTIRESNRNWTARSVWTNETPCKWNALFPTEIFRNFLLMVNTHSFQLSRSYSSPSFLFEFQEKRQRIASSLWRWISVIDFLLRFAALTFTQVLYYWGCFALDFFFFFVASSSSDNVENFSILLLLLKSSKGVEKRSKQAL